MSAVIVLYDCWLFAVLIFVILLFNSVALFWIIDIVYIVFIWCFRFYFGGYCWFIDVLHFYIGCACGCVYVVCLFEFCFGVDFWLGFVWWVCVVWLRAVWVFAGRLVLVFNFICVYYCLFVVGDFCLLCWSVSCLF